MASRRGTFGRQPRVAPSLTSTLIAIAREMENQRDQNIMDAWQKGGTYEGQKVTDEMVLKHWKERLVGISKDDPLYDTYKNAVEQYTYSIAESKMTAQYAMITKPTSGDDQRMVAFYLGWAKKVPKDSEFYRTLQRDAGQYMRAAQAKSDAGAAQRKEEKYKSDLANLGKGSDLANFLVGQDPNAPGVLLQMASRGDADHHIAQLIGAEGANQPGAPGSAPSFYQFDSSDPEQMLRLLGQITPAQYDPRLGEAGGTRRPTDEVLFTDTLNNKSWTGAQIVAAIKKIDPKFDGNFNLAYVHGSINDSIKAVDRQIALARKTGHVTDVQNLTATKVALRVLGRTVKSWPVVQDYEHAKADYLRVRDDPTALAVDKSAAWDAYHSFLVDLVADPRIADNDVMRSQLQGEADMNPQTRTVDESMSGFQNPTDPNQAGDVMKNIVAVNQAKYETDLLRDPNGDYIYTQGDYQKDPNSPTGQTFKPSPLGKFLGVVSRAEVMASNPSAITVMSPTSTGKSVKVLMQATPVQITGVDADGRNVVGDASGTNMTYYHGTFDGVQVSFWGFRVSDSAGNSHQYYSKNQPGDPNTVKPLMKGGVMTLDISGVIGGKKPNMVPNQVGPDTNTTVAPPGFKWVQSQNSADPPRLVVDDSNLVVYASDGAHNAAGIDPVTDFTDPMLAAAWNLPPSERTKLFTSPDFVQEVDTRAHLIAGMTQDASGNWQGTPEQTQAYQNAARADQALVNLVATGDAATIVNNLTKTWSRLTTDGLTPKPQGLANPKLPMDDLKGTKFEALASGVHPGTNIPKLGAPGLAAEGPQIKAGIALTVPAVSNKPVSPGPKTTAGAFQPYVPQQAAKPTSVPPAGTPSVAAPPPVQPTLPPPIPHRAV